MNNIDKFNDNTNNSRNIWKQDEIFDTISNDKIDKFFENYQQFDELGLYVTKEKSSLIYSGHVLLDWEVSGKLYSDFYDAFLSSIKSIVGEDLFIRMWTFFEEKDYLLSNEHKRFDSDPYLDDKFQTILLWDDTIAQFIERRNTFNNVEFHYIVYPNRIFKFIDKLCKEYNIKI
jgi:hypothetical protein